MNKRFFTPTRGRLSVHRGCSVPTPPCASDISSCASNISWSPQLTTRSNFAAAAVTGCTRRRHDRRCGGRHCAALRMGLLSICVKANRCTSITYPPRLDRRVANTSRSCRLWNLNVRPCEFVPLPIAPGNCAMHADNLSTDARGRHLQGKVASRFCSFAPRHLEPKSAKFSAGISRLTLSHLSGNAKDRAR
jgi:hypothetical protein